MQAVSLQYQDSMKQLLRNRGYILVTFGLINQEAQGKASLDVSDLIYFANTNNILNSTDKPDIYATLEEDFTKADGSMRFLPENRSTTLYDNGIVSEALISEKQFSITINFNTLPLDLKGLTLDFGSNPASDFDIVTDTGQVVEIRGNTDTLFVTEEVFEGASQLVITFYAMLHADNRLRVYSILLGYGLNYDNSKVLASTLDNYISLIGEDVPQIDLSVTLENYDKYFDTDNPKSAVNFLETGQEMAVSYGYDIGNGEIEWVPGTTLYCSDWEADSSTATIRCVDSLRFLTKYYYKGTYAPDGKSFYDLAVEVLEDAGDYTYTIDDALKELYTRNPIPNVTHREALQMIANATRCRLFQERDGTISITRDFTSTDEEISASCNGETDYSHIENILDGEAKDEYSSPNTEYTTVDGLMYYIPRDGGTRHTGFISSAISDADGLFESNPIVTIFGEGAYSKNNIELVFGACLPSGIELRTYREEALQQTLTLKRGIVKDLMITQSFIPFDTLEIEFTGTQNPYNRIILNDFRFGGAATETITYTDMTSLPLATKQELVKDIYTYYYVYRKGEEEKKLVDNGTETGGDYTVTFSNPAHDMRATIDGEEAKINESGSYYCTITVPDGEHEVIVYGYEYQITTREYVYNLNLRGNDVTWENPLLDTTSMASDLAEWLAQYYGQTVEYDYDYRGDPKFDVNDIVYQENEYKDDLTVKISQHTFDFGGAFAGHITARRWVDVAGA